MIDALLERFLLPVAAVLILALAAGLMWYKFQAQRNAAYVDKYQQAQQAIAQLTQAQQAAQQAIAGLQAQQAKTTARHHALQQQVRRAKTSEDGPIAPILSSALNGLR